MKLKALRLHGFKSFPDSTEIEFHEGITAVVGPNGCGKSNVSDAIRWVLGEQRPTAIRGARMEEAIFQGSLNRRPVNRASVSLIVSNEDGSLPVPFEEVEIARTVYRDGGSEYSINRASCRLRDVLDLCRDTGLGANAYAVIENRMIDAILSDRAEERRGLFEEAAGIGKYKDRRKAALRRLERAELDLQRLDDVIGEVESKVRSLARQKGKAQRHQTLRDRSLSIEVALARHQLDDLRRRLEETERELAGDRELGEGYVAELRTAETQFETLRLRQVEAEKARGEAASRLERIQEELVRWERELAVAEERISHAQHRLSQIGEERNETSGRIGKLEVEASALRAAEAATARELENLEAERERRREVATVARGGLQGARSDLDALEGRMRDLSRRQVHLEGEAASAEAQGTELGRHLERLQKELADASGALADAESQGDLFADRVAGLTGKLAEREAALRITEEAAAESRERQEEARVADARAQERLAGLEARIRALEEMERSQEGMEPTVRAALGMGDPGILGTLGESLAGEPEVMKAVEAYLGPLAQGLLVRDGATVDRLQRWHREVMGGRGGLILLPLDGVPSASPETSGSLVSALRLKEPGAPWALNLLAGLSLAKEAPGSGANGVGVVSLAGISVDERGVIRIGNPLGSSGVLERREQVKILKGQLDRAQELSRGARVRRDEMEEAVRATGMRLEEARRALRETEDAHRSALMEVQAQEDRRARLDRFQEELARQIEGTRAARSRSLDRAGTAREELGLVTEELDGMREEEQGARRKVAEAQDAWEDARAKESELALDMARKEGDRRRSLERLEDVDSSLAEARARLQAFGDEETSLRGGMNEGTRLREEGSRAMALLFQQREEARQELTRREESANRMGEALQEAERRVRVARSAEREAVDRRHRLELERQELRGNAARIQDRLEGEWGRPLKVLLAKAEPIEGEPDELKSELEDILETLKRIGPVNMLAVEEHQEESARLEFLLEQRDDLKRARDDLRTAIRQINETATRLFRDTFERIQENFQATFQRLFEGGEANLWLEDEEDPLESAVEIHASPRGKKTQRIDLLSGGERALTALSLLFGIYLVKPSPFCVMDEVDAPLDESNIYRFIRLLQEFKDQTQFIVITHNARTIEAGDWIYGVTMEEPGVSRIVGVRLEDALRVSGSVA
jgi:chromosome segregation protein